MLHVGSWLIKINKKAANAAFLLNSFKFFEFKRKLEVFSFVEDFFKLHSWATEEKKRQKQG